jgi:phage baseplate assembly protein gpV
VAYRDGLKSTAQPGEKRIYARDGEGNEVAEIWLKGSGEIVISNGSAEATLGADGTVTVNGAEITPAGDVVSATGISLSTHTHTSAAAGSPTSPPIAAP